MIDIPNRANLPLDTIVCDYNGTIAKDGKVQKSILELFTRLEKEYKIYVITADTFGSVKSQLAGYPCEISILTTDNHTKEKATFLTKLGQANCVAFGNGSNDAQMLHTAALGIAILGDEGCAKETLLASDIICKSIQEGLEILLNPKRLIATLRR